MEAFAYAFHLQLFFVAAGFFAGKTSKRTIKEWIPRQIYTLLIPYFFWVVISFLYNNLDNAEFSNKDFWSIFTNPDGMQPNYWFFPAFIAVSTAYYLIYKSVKRPMLIFIFSALLHMLLGERPIMPAKYNIFNIPDNWPFLIKIIGGRWFGVGAIPHYLFWYSLGAIVFDLITAYTETKTRKPFQFYLIGFISGTISMILFFKKITEINSIISIIYLNNGTHELYRICSTLIILCFIFFISKLLEESPVLNNIGRSSMNFMGLEYITHSYFALSFLPMINLGIPSINSTVHIITITVIQIIINLWISNRINKYIPLLNGDITSFSRSQKILSGSKEIGADAGNETLEDTLANGHSREQAN